MRIAIANDVPLAVEVLRRVLATDTSHKVAWVARDGIEAVQHCTRDRPDLLLMDLVMPQMNGVQATREIMRNCPCAVMVVTASVNHHASLVFEALNAGALDAVRTPSFERLGHYSDASSLLGKINRIGRLLDPAAVPRPVHFVRSGGGEYTLQNDSQPLIVIGASAGGPTALANVLGRLPADFAAPVLVVQHVAKSFSPSLANWMNTKTALTTRIAREGDRIVPGHILLANGEEHFVLISRRRVGYRRFPDEFDYKPSIDALFSSAARLWQGRIIGVLLTGMGKDGALGLMELKRAGHRTIAQSEATCVVYGMPKAAVELGAVTNILPLDRIGPYLARAVGRKSLSVS